MTTIITSFTFRIGNRSFAAAVEKEIGIGGYAFEVWATTENGEHVTLDIIQSDTPAADKVARIRSHADYCIAHEHYDLEEAA